MLALLLISIAFLIKNIYGNWNQIRNVSFKPNYTLLTASFLLEIFIQFFGVFLWLRIVRLFKVNVSYKKVLKIWFVSSLGRYIPGKIWHFAGMTYFLTKEGVNTEVSFTSSFIVQIYSILTGAIIGAFTLVSITKNLNPIALGIFIILCFVLGLIVSNKKLINSFLYFIAEKRKQKKQEIEFSSFYLPLFLLLYVFFWFVRGLSFYLFIKSFTMPEVNARVFSCEFLTATSVFSASYISGLLFLLSPGGVGIREGVMSSLLNKCMGISIGISSMITVFNRIMLTVTELLCLFISLAINWRKSGKTIKK